MSGSFDQLYERISPALFAWAELRIRPTLRPSLSPEDLVQEVWLRASRSLARRDDAPATDFRAWTFGIAKNTLLEACRRLRNLPRPLQAGTTTRMFALEGCPDQVTSIARRLARQETVQRFLAHARELDPDDQQILVWCGLEGMTCRDAATQLGMTHDAVLKRWQRLRARLRDRPWVQTLLAPEG